MTTTMKMRRMVGRLAGTGGRVHWNGASWALVLSTDMDTPVLVVTVGEDEDIATASWDCAVGEGEVEGTVIPGAIMRWLDGHAAEVEAWFERQVGGEG